MKLSIGFLTYNQSSFKYLPFFLDSLRKAVSFLEDNYSVDTKIMALDNSVDFDANYNYLKEFEDLKLLESGVNIGFAKGFNILINKAIKDSADFFLVINPDVILEEDSLYKMLSFLDSKKEASSVSPLILKWDFLKKEKSNRIDSLGIGFKSSYKFFDMGQNKLLDEYQDLPFEIFGPSGACSLFRTEALKTVAYNNGEYLEFFDELMFMYKEDIDLAYRLQLASFKSYLVSDAFIYHDRSLSSKTSLIKHVFGLKRNKYRSLSFLNQLILNYKFSGLAGFSFFIRNTALLAYGFLFELKSTISFFFLKKEIRKRKETLNINEAGIANLVKLMKK